MEYELELEPVSNKDGKLWTSGVFDENPIVVDDKFIALLNSTNQKINLDMDIMTICRFDYRVYNTKTKEGYTNRKDKQITGTLAKLVNFFRTEKIENKLLITKIFMEVYI